MFEQEIWKDIPQYEGLYQVSNLGRVKSLERYIKKENGFQKHIKEKIKTIRITKQGYQVVDLYKNKSYKTLKVHRLVALAFLNKNNFKSVDKEDIKNINIDELEINHKDENKQNNNINNLEWCTSKYNCNYGKRIEKIHIIQRKKVNQYDLKGNFIKQWNSRKEIYETLGIPISNVSSCCLGYTKTAHKYIWKYYDNN